MRYAGSDTRAYSFAYTVADGFTNGRADTIANGCTNSATDSNPYY